MTYMVFPGYCIPEQTVGVEVHGSDINRGSSEWNISKGGCEPES